MSLTKKNLTIIIVSFKSNHVIEDCINSIDKEIKVLIVDNSNDENFKAYIENKFDNVECILSPKNLGMGAGNNLAIKSIITDFAFIINPDVVLNNDTIDEIIIASKSIRDFGIIAPISNNLEYPNFNLGKKYNFNNRSPFQVISIDGYAMLLNLKKLKNLDNFRFFDENIFLYLENDDLCKEIKKRNQNIYVVPTSKINHIGGGAVNPKFKKQIELSRNWHWMWSKFYYNKKHSGYIYAFLTNFNNLLTSLLKILFYLITFRIFKSQIYLMRLYGLVSSMIGLKSYYRPKLED
ncbi:glycosyltransferase family 2 protein [Candidatus Pelagibacter communis]|uniref:glycosyltransferase family 2 protein n=1 Tax=Candidatus Pelagibacter TaxID=198251 RepID=UPI003EDEBC64